MATFILSLIAIALLAGAIERLTAGYRRLIRQETRINCRNKPWQIGFKANPPTQDMQ